MTQLEKLKTLAERFGITITPEQKAALLAMSPLPKYQIAYFEKSELADAAMAKAQALTGVWGFRVKPQWAVFVMKQTEAFI